MHLPRLAPDSGLKGRLILAALWLGVAVVLVAFRRVLLPFAVALVVAYLLEPLVTRLARVSVKGRHLPRWGAVILLYAVFFGLLYLLGVTLIPQLYRELAGLTRAGAGFFNSLTPERIGEASREVEAWLLSRGIPLDLSGTDSADGPAYGLAIDLERSLRDGLASLSRALQAHFLDAVGAIKSLVEGVAGFVFRFFFVLMVAAFILIDWEHIGRFARGLFPPDRRADFDELRAAIDKKLSGVVRGQAVICLVNGALTAIGLLVFGIPFAFVLTLVATVLSAIPIFGTIISSVPIVLFGLTQGFRTGVAILAWIIGIHALEAYLLNPKIMGAQAHIHPVVVAFALLAGEATFGFVGALFAVPVAGILLAGFNLARERALRRLEPAAQPPAPGAD